jgi:hypothetical protein
MNYETTQIIQTELEPGERIIWSGQPAQGIKFRASDMLKIPISFLWGGFTIYWEYYAIKSGHPLLFLPGVPFVLIGLYIMFGRFIVESEQRAKTYYGLTNKRVIIVSGLTQKNVEALSLQSLFGLSLSESSDGTGSIPFGPTAPFSLLSPSATWLGIGRHDGPKFDLISDAKHVYQQIRKAQKSAS